MKKNNALGLSLVTILLLFLIYCSLFVGTVPYSEEKRSLWLSVLWQLRFPRMMLALLTGMSLALGGVVYQAILKNPLAEPYLLGVSSGAALGAIIGIIIGTTILPPFALVGALCAFLLIVGIARISGKVSSYSLILSGIVLNSFFAALISLSLSLFPRKTFGILYWLMGNLEVYDPGMLMLFGIVLACSILLILMQHRTLDLLSLGEEDAYHLGVPVARARTVLLILSSCMVAMSVSLTGIIGFVGLVVPHLARGLVGTKHLHVIPVAGLLGAIFLLSGNVLMYSMLKSTDLPIGVFTSLLGVPFLFYVFMKK